MPLDLPVLTGRWVQLEPLRAEHRDSLRQAANDEQIWAHTLTAANGPYFDVRFDDALAEQVTGRRAPFAVRRVADGRLLGSSSYLDIHLKPYFPAKTFMIKLEGQKGDEADKADWSSKYEQDK